MTKKLLLVFCAMFCFFSSLAQTWPDNKITVHINSNNPVFPFPQFLDYKNGKTLGRQNPQGVSDIEMEKTIREAYQIMMNRAVYTGEVVANTKYIIFNPTGLGGPNGTGPAPNVSEGDGYALLAMAYMSDKPAFDGLFMYVNDHKRSQVEFFKECGKIRNPGYKYGKGTVGWKPDATADGDPVTQNIDCSDCNSAADGDYDIALALLVANYQWPTAGIKDACGKTRTYKSLAIDYFKTLTDTVFAIHQPMHYQAQPNWVCPPVNSWDVCPYGTLTPDPRVVTSSSNAYLSGDIGWDGYVKNGNTFRDATDFVNRNPTYTWQGQTWRIYREQYSFKNPFIDYVAPSYFKAFADYLSRTDSAKYAWNIYQYRRAEASSDWLMGQLNLKGLYPTAGSFTVNSDGSTTTFGDVDMAEDSRNPWRTILNYVWNGNPSYTWNPVTHEVEKNKPNTFEYNNAIKFGELAKGWSKNVCIKLGNDPTALQFGGVATIGDNINSVTGAMDFGVGEHINWNLGSGAAAIVAYHHDKNDAASKKLLEDWYRQLVLMWDATDEKQALPDSRYINSLPLYFHDWFRVLGLLVTTGNYQSPQFMSAPVKANLKIYNQSDKSIAFAPSVVNGVVRTKGDVITYTFSYRNFSSVAATGIKISYPFPPEYEFVSASDGGALSGTNVVWNLADLPGYTSTGETSADWKTFDPTKYTTHKNVVLQVRVKSGQVNKIVCNQPTITAGNSDAHTSSEYPNNDTPTMERNCVDLVARSLTVVKKSDRVLAKKGDVINFTVAFENSSKAGWISGGREGIRVTYANGFPGPNTIVNYFRFLHGAAEPYINPGNYRISYYLNDAARIGIFDPVKNVNGWKMTNTITGEGGSMTFGSEAYTFGEDRIGQWNQRLIMRFPDTLMSTTQHTNMFFAKDGEPNLIKYVHKGIAAPFRTAVQMEAIGAPGSGCGSIPFKDLVTDDWSYTKNVDAGSDDKSLYFPISPSWFNYNSTYDTLLKVPITNVHPDACLPLVTTTFDRLLVEEFDGKVWRRVLGKGPVPGREVGDVIVSDTLPLGLTFDSFSIQETLGVKAELQTVNGRQVIVWKISSMLPGAAGSLAYSAIAQSDCSGDKIVKNTAWIRSSADSPVDSSVSITITCKEIPVQVVGGSTMYKKASKTNVVKNDEITYSIAFKQTDGTISNPKLTSTADWTTACGESMFSFNNTGSERAERMATYDFSHGKNGILITKVAPKNETPFSLIFRHDRTTNGSPHCGTFKGLQLQFSKNSCAQAVVKLFENGVQVGATKTNISYAAPQDSMTIKVKLEDDKLLFWINNFNAIPYTFSNIKLLDAGYVGFYNNSGTEPHKLVSWYTNFDSGFKIDLVDALSTQVSYVPNSAKILFDQNGKYTSPINYTAAGTKLDWILVADKKPMLYGDSVAFEFKANVLDCGNGFVQNNTYANMLGQPQFKIGATKVTTCGTPPTCLPPATVKASRHAGVCQGDTALLKANFTLQPAGIPSNYRFVWYKKGTLPVAADYKTVYSAKEISNLQSNETWFIRVEDGTSGVTTCFLEDTITIKITSKPIVKIDRIKSDTTLCDGETLSLYTMNQETVTWITPDKFSASSVIYSSSLPKDGFYKAVIGSGACTASDSVKVNVATAFKVNIDRSLSDSSLCKGDTLRLYTTNGQTAVWQTPDGKSVTDTLYTDLIPVEGKYYATAGSGNCLSKDSVKVSVTPIPTPVLTPSSSAFCGNGSVLLTVNVSGADPAATYQFQHPSASLQPGTSLTYQADLEGDWKVLFKQNGCSVFSNTVTLRKVSSLVPEVSLDEEISSVCQGEMLTIRAKHTYGGPKPVFEWFINNVKQASTDSSLTSPTLKPTDKIKVRLTSNDPCANPKIVQDSILAPVVSKLKAVILSPDKAVVTNKEDFSLISEPLPAKGYSGIWQKEGQGNIINNTSETTSITGLTDPSKTNVYWIVTDSLKKCKPDTATVVITRIVGSFAFAGEDKTICIDSLLKLNGTGSQPGQWKAISQGAVISPEGIIQQKIDGENSFSYCITDDVNMLYCDTVVYNVLPMRPANLTISVDKIGGLGCEGDSVFLKADATPGTIQWAFGASGATSVLTGWKNGDEVQAFLASSELCAVPSSDTSNSIVLEGKSRTDSAIDLQLLPGSSGSYCKGTLLQLIAQTNLSGLSYKWVINNETVDQDSIKIQLVETDFNGLVTASDTGCFTAGNIITSTEAFNFNAVQPQTVKIDSTGNGKFLPGICQGDPVTFTATDLGISNTYTWLVNGKPMPGQTSNIAKIEGLGLNDVVKVVVTPEANCPGSNLTDSAIVDVQAKPRTGFVNGTGPVYFCQNLDTVLTALENSVSYSYLWKRNNLELATSGKSSIHISEEGLYSLFVTNGVCRLRSDIEVFKTNLSVSITAIPLEFAPGETVVLTGNVSGIQQGQEVHYTWQPDSEIGDPTAVVTSIVPLQTMYVVLKVKTAEGCMAKDSVQLKKRDQLFIPNALTPNSNDQNAFWGIKGAENYPDLEIKVYNRWGNKVHEQKGYSEPWDGTINGKDLPAGTYYFLIKHRNLNKPLTGDLTIVR